MTALRAIATWLKKVGAWLALHWQWLLPPIAAVFWLLFRQKKVVVESGEIVGHDQAVVAADAKAAQELAAARNLEAEKLNQIGLDHTAAVSKLNGQLKAEADKVVDDPEAANSFLKDVGNDMRK